MSKDHYISQFYLRGFIDPASPNPKDPGVWVVDRKFFGKPKRRSPSAIGYERGYNDWTDPTPARVAVSLEQEYGELETWAAPIIRKLHLRDTRLDTEEREKLAIFMAVHTSRPPGVRETVAAVLDETERRRWEAHLADDQFVAGLIEHMERHFPPDQRTSPAEVRSMLLHPDVTVRAHPDNVKAEAYGGALINLTPLLVRFSWHMWVAPKGRSFLTCDRSLIMISDDHARLDPDYTWRDNRHIRAFFPLTRQVALEMRGHALRSLEPPDVKPGTRIPMGRISPGQLTVRNQTVIDFADRFVFCSDEAQARWALDQLRQGERQEAELAPMAPATMVRAEA